MRKIFTMSIGLIIFITGNLVAHAEGSLNKNDIQHFMNAMEPLQALGKKYDMNDDDDMPMDSFDMATFSPMTYSLKKVKGHKAYGEFESIVRDAGFSSAEHWAHVGDRIMRSYMTLKMAEEMTPEKKAEMQASIAEVEKNEYLSPDMKKQILNSLKQSMAMVTNLSEGHKADQDVLKPFLPKLELLFKETE